MGRKEDIDQEKKRTFEGEKERSPDHPLQLCVRITLSREVGGVLMGHKALGYCLSREATKGREDLFWRRNKGDKVISGLVWGVKMRRGAMQRKERQGGALTH